MAYQTTCPKCQNDGLRLRQFNAVVYGVYITPDGFSLNDATQIDTENETVWCGSCNWEGPLINASDDPLSEPCFFHADQPRQGCVSCEP